MPGMTASSLITMTTSSTATEVQCLLRFLTHNAKVPLADAIPKISALRQRGFNTPDAIAKSEVAMIQSVFDDEKIAKQIVSAAKRMANPKKRGASTTPLLLSKAKKPATIHDFPGRTVEDDLLLPVVQLTEKDLAAVEIQTNRAPLFLAFAVTVLAYTMPDQPLSSRLSLAQAVVSANSQSKAKSIGLLHENTAEDDGWAEGQPKVRIMGREIAVLRRHFVPPVKQEVDTGKDGTDSRVKVEDSQETIPAEDESYTHDAFWGLDLDALRKSNGPLVAGKLRLENGPPVYRPESAHSYLLSSMSIIGDEKQDSGSAPSSRGKQSAIELRAKKQRAAAIVLGAIDLLCESWATALTKEDLDQRAWSWYIRVRPDVQQGPAGWGQKGKVCISDILSLRRQA